MILPSYVRRKMRATVPCGKIKLVIVANPVLIPNGGKPRTHGRKSTIDLFNEGRIVLEIGTVPADRSGITLLNGRKNFHVSMRYYRRPVMTENNHRQDVSQNYVYNNPDSERNKGFDTGFG